MNEHGESIELLRELQKLHPRLSGTHFPGSPEQFREMMRYALEQLPPPLRANVSNEAMRKGVTEEELCMRVFGGAFGAADVTSERLGEDFEDAKRSLLPAEREELANVAIDWLPSLKFTSFMATRGEARVILIGIAYDTALSRIMDLIVEVLSRDFPPSFPGAMENDSVIIELHRWGEAFALAQPHHPTQSAEMTSHNDAVSVVFQEALVRFVILHECAHILLGHYSEGPPENVGRFQKRESKLNLNDRQLSEIDADCFAVAAIDRDKTNRLDHWTQFAPFGIDAYFSFMAYSDKLRDRHRWLSDTHPPSADRLNNIRAIFRESITLPWKVRCCALSIIFLQMLDALDGKTTDFTDLREEGLWAPLTCSFDQAKGAWTVE